MNSFDFAVLTFLNRFAQRSQSFDKLVDLFFGNMLLEGGFVTALLWWAWFRGRETAKRDRSLVVAGMGLTVVALVLTRVAALLAPYRVRPRYVPELHFRLPVGSSNYDMFNWNSFPSDHAVLYFCLGTTLFFISRRVGVLALLHAFFVVCLTRIYLGIHYPTDILAGIVIGVGCACLALAPAVQRLFTRPSLYWMENSPRSFYPCFSLCMLIIASEFAPLHEVLVDVWRAAKALTMHI